MALLLVGGAGAQPLVVIEDTGELNVYDTYVRGSLLQRALRRAGFQFSVVRDGELGGRPLNEARIIILPSNPSLLPSTADTIRRFCGRGGKLIALPPVPPVLLDLVGLERTERLVVSHDGELEAVVPDRSLIPALPEEWIQRDWVRQPFEPTVNGRVVARWRTGGTGRATPAAAVIVGSGAFVGAIVNGDDRVGEAEVLLGLITHYAPDLWHAAVPRMLAGIGQVGDCRSLAEVKRRVEAAPLAPDRRALAMAAVTSATERRARAEQLYETARRAGQAVPKPGAVVPIASAADRYLPTAELAWQAQQAAEQAYYLSQTPRPGEFRGVWLQNAGGLREWDWRQTIVSLRENNVTALFLNVLNPGYANYPSTVLPHVTVEGADPLAEALYWCRQLGVQCHVWMMVNYIRPLAPADWFDGLQHQGRLQQNRSGATLRWLRPGDERNRELVVRMAREVAERYDVDGIHLDYIRYNGPDCDYSPAEREAFERFVDDPEIDWDRDLAVGGRRRADWTRFRQQQVSAQVRDIADAVRAVKPRLKVSAAVYPIFVDALYNVGQDPPRWAHEGWVDFLCPMSYQTNDTTFYRYLTAQQRDVGDRVPLYPGVAAWRQEAPADTIAQVRALRELGMPGFVLFHLDRRLVGEWLPAMRLGITADAPAQGPVPFR